MTGERGVAAFLVAIAVATSVPGGSALPAGEFGLWARTGGQWDWTSESDGHVIPMFSGGQTNAFCFGFQSSGFGGDFDWVAYDIHIEGALVTQVMQIRVPEFGRGECPAESFGGGILTFQLIGTWSQAPGMFTASGAWGVTGTGAYAGLVGSGTFTTIAGGPPDPDSGRPIGFSTYLVGRSAFLASAESLTFPVYIDHRSPLDWTTPDHAQPQFEGAPAIGTNLVCFGRTLTFHQGPDVGSFSIDIHGTLAQVTFDILVPVFGHPNCPNLTGGGGSLTFQGTGTAEKVGTTVTISGVFVVTGAGAYENVATVGTFTASVEGPPDPESGLGTFYDGIAVGRAARAN